jgi:aryl-alcohol dehydrogenase-like predicted oxidoreductase
VERARRPRFPDVLPSLEVLDVVNLRLGNAHGPQPGSLAEPFETLAGLQRQGLIRHLGVSNATAEQVTEARAIAPIVCAAAEHSAGLFPLVPVDQADLS